MRTMRHSGESPWTYLLLVLILLPFLFPLAWMLLSSLKTQVQNTAYPPVWVFTPTLNNYREVFLKNPFFTFTLNSLIVAAGSTGLALVLGLPGAYAVARFKQTGIALAILTARMAPGIAYLIPWFILFTKLKMIDTYMALILTHLIVALPLVLWVMIGFFEDVPGELIEAARIDGCSNFSAFLRVALPLVKPGIVATAILAFHLLVEQLPLLAHHRGVQDADAADCGLQLPLLRGDQLGRPDGGGDRHHAAGLDPVPVHPEAHRPGADVRRPEGVRRSVQQSAVSS